MSFSSDVKAELARQYSKSTHCQIAELATMGKETAQMMKEKKCVHVSPRSVSPNLWIDSIEVQDVYLYDELGRIEAAWFFKLNELGPFIVDIDTKGQNLFDRLDEQISENKDKALQELGIDPDFQFTKLY